jgi:U3 small nucleolar RNA-associated protein 13
MDTEQLSQLLEYIRDWNTNAKRSRTAQVILHAILRSHSAEELQKIRRIKEASISVYVLFHRINCIYF